MSASCWFVVTSHHSIGIGSRPRSRWNSIYFFCTPNDCPSPLPPCCPTLHITSVNCPLHDQWLPFDCCFHCRKPISYPKLDPLLSSSMRQASRQRTKSKTRSLLKKLAHICGRKGNAVKITVFLI
jgi:hypothetical protein